MAESNVTLLDFWASPYGMRVKIALAEKGISYERKDEDLKAKSSLLLEMNPVHKVIPVLIHSGKPICESLNIVQYIDETWNHKPSLLPSDPYKRSRARFWGDYVDKNVYNTLRKAVREEGKEQEESNKEFMKGLKIMEDELGEKPFFGGEEFGYVDVALVPIICWFYTAETLGKSSIEEECPKLVVWTKRCMQKESVATSLPPPHKIFEYAIELRQIFGLNGPAKD